MTTRDRNSNRSRARKKPNDSYRHEDANYRNLKTRLRADIRRETQAGNHSEATLAKHALAEARRHRRMALRVRRDPDYIPF